MENTVMSIIPLSELEAKFAQIVEEKLRSILVQDFPKQQTRIGGFATRKEVSSRLRISLPTLSTLTKAELLKSYRIGGRVLYKWEEVEAALQKVVLNKYKRKAYVSE